MKLIVKIGFFCAVLGLVSCKGIIGEEIGRLPITKVSHEGSEDWKTTSLNLEKDEKLWMWTEMDLEYEGALELEYRLLVINQTDTIGWIRLNPFEKKVTLGETKTTIGSRTTWKYTGRMDFWQVPEKGKYTFCAYLASSNNKTLQLKKANLVFKRVPKNKED